MHELGIASAMLEAVEAESRKHSGRICKVGVRIGALSGVDTESLRFCFELLVKDTQWDPLELEIEAVPRRHECMDCGQVFLVGDQPPDCPRCGSARTDFLSGDELDLAYLEMIPNEPAAS
jgi:hydrogenase nickel incorporation protein HypA/HybF